MPKLLSEKSGSPQAVSVLSRLSSVSSVSSAQFCHICPTILSYMHWPICTDRFCLFHKLVRLPVILFRTIVQDDVRIAEIIWQAC